MSQTDIITVKPKILCIDDEELILKLLQRILKKDYEVITASDGVEGIKLYDLHKDLNIVTTDMNMPGISGLEVLTHIANKYRGVSTILIASCNDHEIEEARKLNTPYVPKPFNPEFLKDIVKGAYINHLRTKEIIERFAKTTPIL